jgi:macrolide-specific efflux system membrane fusion protein
MNARWLWVSLALVGTAAVPAWWLIARERPAPTDGETWVAVERRDLVASVATTGKVNAMVGAEVRVGSRVSGQVKRLYANIGDVVRDGQVIAELERDDQEALLAQRRAELSVAGARLSSVEALRPREIERAAALLRDAEATAVLAGIGFDRQAALLEQGIVPRQEVDIARKEREVTEARLTSARRDLDLAKERYVEDGKSARAQVEQAAAAVRVLEAQVSYATLRAPISGIISSISTQQGETVAAGLNSPTFVTIIDLQKLQVDAYVDETDIGKIRVRQAATFTVDSFPDRDFHAAVEAIYPKAVVMDNVVYYDVVLHIDEALTGELRPEMTTNVVINLDARKGVLTVPLRAVTREQGKSIVFVSRNGQPARQVVKVGWKDAEWIEITAGLTEQDRVLVRPAQTTNGGA